MLQVVDCAVGDIFVVGPRENRNLAERGLPSAKRTVSLVGSVKFAHADRSAVALMPANSVTVGSIPLCENAVR